MSNLMFTLLLIKEVDSKTAIEEIDSESFDLQHNVVRRSPKKRSRRGKKKCKKDDKKCKRKRNRSRKNSASKSKKNNKDRRSGKRKGKKSQKSQARQDFPSCFSKLYKYASRLKKATNIRKQFARIMVSKEQIEKKAAKKDDFNGTLTTLVTALGGDKGNPKCAGVADTKSSGFNGGI